MRCFIISENIVTILASPVTMVTLGVILLFILAFIYFSRLKIDSKMLKHISLLVALSVLLHHFNLYHQPQGGSLTLGSMLPLLFIGFRYGSGMGMLGSFIYSLINFVQNPYILSPLQVIFDYPLPFMLLGFISGQFKKYYWLGVIAAFIGRFICHVISGVVFFAEYAPVDMSPLIYSLAFNAAYLIPELIICLTIMKIIPVQKLLASLHIPACDKNFIAAAE